MADAGILTEDDRVELIEGEIVQMTPIGSRHAACVKKVTKLFNKTIGDDCIVSVQDPVRLHEFSEPEPDIALLKPSDDFYSESHPGPKDVLLVVEVAEASLGYDRDIKVPLYAKTGIPEVWLVNLEEESIELYRKPSEAGYQETRILQKGDILSPSAFPGLQIGLEEVFV